MSKGGKIFLAIIILIIIAIIRDDGTSGSVNWEQERAAREYDKNHKKQEWKKNYEASHPGYTASGYVSSSGNSGKSTGSASSTSKSYGATSSKSSTGKSSYKNSNSKTSMPDCDDYEDFDEFMDDWDGRMPDGSDAEDYWENW